MARIAAPPRFRGELVLPGDAAYDEIRRIYNERVQGRPAAIARCAGPADVAAAIALARKHDLELSVRGGGHSIGGWSSGDDVLVIDLTLMRWVRIDPDARTAWIGGGAQAGDILAEGERFGLVAALGAGSSIGATGLTTGLGEGYLTPKHGYGVDQILELELVTAAGDILRVTPESNADLFWALRGAAPNFGVVTALKLRLHPAPERAVGGWIVFGERQLEPLTRQLWTSMREGSEHFWPQPIYTVDADGQPVVRMLPGHTGPAEQAERELGELCAVAPPIADDRRVGSYIDLIYGLPDAPGRREWDLLRFPFDGDHEPQIAALLEQVRVDGDRKLMPGRMILLWRTVTPRSTAPPAAAPHLPGICMALMSIWTDPSRDEVELGWVARTMEAFRAAGVVDEPGNVMNHVSTADAARVRRLYGDEANARLAALKAIHDPENRFRRNFNISPDTDPNTGI